MALQRASPTQYFETEIPINNVTNYTPLFIFGGLCLVAIVAIAIAITYKK